MAAMSPVEPPTLSLEASDEAENVLGARLCAPPAPAAADLAVLLPAFATSSRTHRLSIDVKPRKEDWLATPCALAAFVRCIEAHLKVYISCVDAAGAIAGCSVTPVVVRPYAEIGCVCVFASMSVQGVDPVAFSIDALELAGRPVPSLALPAVVKLGANHNPANAGRLWKAAKEGDAAGVISALCDGCSTEEADEVRAVSAS